MGLVSGGKIYVAARVPSPLENASIDSKFLAGHAQQVRMALPGGLGIVGVYLFSPSNAGTGALLSQALTAVIADEQKRENDFLQWDEPDGTARVALHICALSRKVVAKCYRGGATSSEAASWAYQPVAAKLHSISATVSIDVQLPVLAPRNPARAQSVLGMYLSALEPALHSLREARVAIDGVQAGGEPLNVKNTAHQATVYLSPLPPAAPSAATACGTVHVRGMMACRALCFAKATVADAARALKMDALRTLMARITALCEGLEDQLSPPTPTTATLPSASSSSSAQAPASSSSSPASAAGAQPHPCYRSPLRTCSLPVRVTFALAGVVPVSDYVFADEDTENFSEAIARVNQLLGCNFSKKHATCLEDFADVTQAPVAASPAINELGDARGMTATSTAVATSGSHMAKVAVAVLSGLMALLGLLVIMSKQSETRDL